MSGRAMESHFFVLEEVQMDQEAIVNQIKALIEPHLANRQVELVELTCHPSGGRVLLRCLVDTARGITLEELSSLNQAIGAILDEHDLIPWAYLLEVSSPGLDRPLKSWIDFERVIGRRLKIATTVPIQSRWEYSGELVNANEEAIVLRLDSGDKLRIALSEVARAAQEVKL